MADAEGDLLILLLDMALLRPDNADLAALEATPADILSQLLAFTNAYTMMNSRNRLAIFGGQHDMSHLVHMSLGEDSGASAASVFPASSLHGKLMDLVGQCGLAVAEAEEEAAAHGTAAKPRAAGSGHTYPLSGALSRALCLMHRLQHQRGGGARQRGRPRVLCVLGSPDAPMQYIPVMNAIFSAQRAEVVIDAVVLAAEDSSFLQQAAHLTGGLYFKPASARGLLGCLLNNFACDTSTRGQLDVTQALGVDFRASCFCHKYVIESGYVCSVCLSIFCQPSRSCSTCGTNFAGAAAAAVGTAGGHAGAGARAGA